MKENVVWKTSRVASEDDCRDIENIIGIILPKSYREFVMSMGFGGGMIGDQHFVIWDPDEIVEYNDGYEVWRNAPSLTLFGGDGGGLGYAFDISSGSARIVSVPLDSLFSDEARDLGPEMSDLFKRSDVL